MKFSSHPSPQTLILTLLFTVFFIHHSSSFSSSPNHLKNNISKFNPSEPHRNKFTVHDGPVLTGPITLHIIWYGSWNQTHKLIIRNFINSISTSPHHSPSPSVTDWWNAVRLYTDKTGKNISSTVRLGIEKNDRFFSHGKTLSYHSIRSIIMSATTTKTKPLPVSKNNGSVYLLLTAYDVLVVDAVNCGFHNFMGLLPYAWVGYPEKKSLDPMCSYPFVVPGFVPHFKPLKSPNGDIGADAMVSTLAALLVNVVTDPFFSGWNDDYYRSDEGVIEVADPCFTIYGSGGGGMNPGHVFTDKDGASYNMHGISGKRFLVQWVWSLAVGDCWGPNVIG